MTKTNIIIVIVSILFVGGLAVGVQLYQDGASSRTSSSQGSSDNISIVDGKQQILITASQGYRPRLTVAKANMPTEIKIQGKNAYGCEAAVRIPQVNYSKIIDPTGSDIIDIPPQNPGDTIYGSCGMGMYSFQIKFED